MIFCIKTIFHWIPFDKDPLIAVYGDEYSSMVFIFYIPNIIICFLRELEYTIERHLKILTNGNNEVKLFSPLNTLTIL